MTLVLLAHLRVEELAHRPNLLRRECGTHASHQRFGAGQTTRFDQRRHDADVFCGLFVTLLDSTHAVSDLETDVPKKSDELFERTTRRLIRGCGDEHEDVDVGGG